VKRYVISFVSIVLVALAIVPAANVLSNTLLSPKQQTSTGDEPWWTYATYNLDLGASLLNRLLYRIGISTDPQQVIVGRDGWLYLGDEHAEIRSVARRGQTPDDVARGCEIAAASEVWEARLKQSGVRSYRFIIAPDKGTIYPEHLPDWARPQEASALDALAGCAGNGSFLDLRETLLRAREEAAEPLYYRTDTHWNSLGAGYAFAALMSTLAPAEPPLTWEQGQATEVIRVDFRSGGDLARFLRLQASLADIEPVVAMLANTAVETTHYDHASGRVIRSGGNPEFDVPRQPVRVVSPAALNDKKVLWLRDSFGNALAPYMAATFTESVQLHWSEAFRDAGPNYADLVDAWRPDYVIVSVVERNALDPLLARQPKVGNVK